MKRFIMAALSSLSLLAVSCYDEQIEVHSVATEGIRDSMKDEMNEVAKNYSAECETEKNAAIATSETYTKSWVNTHLTKYFTAS